tara:strand:+ start:1317 stop:1457 length:141 start_codon:yes stop_codon:yes gene_type:complete
MKALIFLIVAWVLLAILVENIDIHKAYVAMLGGWVGIFTIKLKEKG